MKVQQLQDLYQLNLNTDQKVVIQNLNIIDNLCLRQLKQYKQLRFENVVFFVSEIQLFDSLNNELQTLELIQCQFINQQNNLEQLIKSQNEGEVQQQQENYEVKFNYAPRQIQIVYNMHIYETKLTLPLISIGIANINGQIFKYNQDFVLNLLANFMRSKNEGDLTQFYQYDRQVIDKQVQTDQLSMYADQIQQAIQYNQQETIVPNQLEFTYLPNPATLKTQFNFEPIQQSINQQIDQNTKVLSESQQQNQVQLENNESIRSTEPNSLAFSSGVNNLKPLLNAVDLEAVQEEIDFQQKMKDELLQKLQGDLKVKVNELQNKYNVSPVKNNGNVNERANLGYYDCQIVNNIQSPKQNEVLMSLFEQQDKIFLQTPQIIENVQQKSPIILENPVSKQQVEVQLQQVENKNKPEKKEIQKEVNDELRMQDMQANDVCTQVSKIDQTATDEHISNKLDFVKENGQYTCAQTTQNVVKNKQVLQNNENSIPITNAIPPFTKIQQQLDMESSIISQDSEQLQKLLIQNNELLEQVMLQQKIINKLVKKEKPISEKRKMVDEIEAFLQSLQHK
ncbi:Hypothetical_protein [Hexamita inflata]|uniref:Hypothetical_protein n=1 Tax=Hexamita inflata TaxID=28002 RepID=A0AA86QRP4_9EUKA|nr:Hypothetical protein HINF_LOCUS47077 [Hexamita inflata]